MRSLLIVSLIFASAILALAQNEQSPMVEKEITYKDWTYKNVRTDDETNLRNYTKGKKLVMVVYFAPWCGNWRHDAPMLERLYEKYQANGLGVIAIGEYDPVASMKANLDSLKVTFPVVYESQDRADKQKTLHYEYRKAVGDTRNWGSPWYIFLSPSVMEKKGDVITKKTFVINGELIETEGEQFIRKQLGLPAIDAKTTTSQNGKIEVCDPAKTGPEIKKP